MVIMNKKEYKFLINKYNKINPNRYLFVFVNGVHVYPNSLMFENGIIHFIEYENDITSRIHHEDIYVFYLKASDVDGFDIVSGDDIISFDGDFITYYIEP